MPNWNSLDTASAFQHIDENAHEYVERLRALLRMPSVAVRNEGLDECAAYLADRLRDLGLESAVIPTQTCPMVVAAESQPDPSRPTLLLTSHYDVQPPEPLDMWTYPPYDAHIEGDRITARGATDAKGNLVALLSALDAIRETSGQFPINIKVMFDGAEEQGSPQIDGFLAEHRDRIEADAIVTYDAGFAPTDHPFIWLGSSGKLSVEMRATGSTKDMHSSRARLAPHGGWKLIHALSTMRSPDGRVTIDGFDDNVRPPNADERAILETYPWDDASYMEELGCTEFLGGVTGTRALEKLLFEPSFSITGLNSGYQGQGTKEVLPHLAIAKLEFRLAANQTADEIYEKLQAHLQRHGFGEMSLERLSWTDPTQAPLDSDIATALTSAARAVYGKPVAIKPRHESSGRQAIWLGQQIGAPSAISGIGPPNWRGHAPDEFMLVSYYINGIKFIVATIAEYARRTSAGA
jgi:acetylornithine deacetylase/succinyl-diaminopimelate desuccinylase-like protein